MQERKSASPSSECTPGRATCFSHGNTSQRDTNRVPKRARDSRLEPGPSPVLLKCPVPTTLSAGWGAPAGWRERRGQVARHSAFAGPGPRREPEATPAHSAPGTPARARRTSQQPHTAERKFVVSSPLHLGSFVTQQSSRIQWLTCHCQHSSDSNADGQGVWQCSRGHCSPHPRKLPHASPPSSVGLSKGSSLKKKERKEKEKTRDTTSTFRWLCPSGFLFFFNKLLNGETSRLFFPSREVIYFYGPLSGNKNQFWNASDTFRSPSNESWKVDGPKEQTLCAQTASNAARVLLRERVIHRDRSLRTVTCTSLPETHSTARDGWPCAGRARAGSRAHGKDS